ncbi:hypothetical protein L1F30_03005 [Simiduia sp. 21SJ11W-1]|uniref:hypothetical protein n=1 Tax=Simiduia sp. 21SJ11W-1 TaxID=2909669 RepID=UPI0020A1C006|nr:hypothetical protein [Simiduia sp. 21SJ11W-1]UTA48523.1 hypothetical protein L1F30_03005 [Simiduia sp. 21SJ11W-1]
MKLLCMVVISLLVACTPLQSTKAVKVQGWVMMSYVSTPSGMYSGYVLHTEDGRKILLESDSTQLLDELAGKQVVATGALRKEHAELFHTEYILQVERLGALAEAG